MQSTGQGPFPQSPICLALILAQDVSYDNETGLLSIVGPYSSLSVEQFPVNFISMQAYTVLTACDGQVMVELQMVDVNEVRPPVFRQLVSAYFDGPQDVQEVIFHHFNVTIPVDGEYRLLLTVYRSDFTHPEFVVERRLIVAPLL
jgi:hypothetical protein